MNDEIYGWTKQIFFTIGVIFGEEIEWDTMNF